jgi:hypothetical protein
MHSFGYTKTRSKDNRSKSFFISSLDLWCLNVWWCIHSTHTHKHGFLVFQVLPFSSVCSLSVCGKIHHAQRRFGCHMKSCEMLRPRCEKETLCFSQLKYNFSLSSPSPVFPFTLFTLRLSFVHRSQWLPPRLFCTMEKLVMLKAFNSG